MANSTILLVGLLAVLARPGFAAAVISEVFLAGLPGSPVPDAVEITGLNTLGRTEVDLVVIDASALGPLVWQVVTLPATSAVVLAVESAWPANVWVEGSSPPNVFTIPAGDWRFNGSRTLLLFDRKTNLTGNLVSIKSQQHLLNGAALLDALTWRRGAAATAWAGEPILDTAGGYAISRPYSPEGHWASPMIGTADALGFIAGSNPAYQLSPGQQNFWPDAHMPEPAGLALVAAGALFCGLRRPIMVGYAR